MTTISPANFSFKDANGNLGNVLTLTASDILLLNTALQDLEDLKSAYAIRKPIGASVEWNADWLPDDGLWENGAEYDQGDYNKLFNAIGYTWGSTTATKANCSLGTAHVAGVNGNSVRVTVTSSGTSFVVQTYFGGVLKDSQLVASAAALNDNFYIDFDKTVTLTNGTDVTMTGGANGSSFCVPTYEGRYKRVADSKYPLGSVIPEQLPNITAQWLGDIGENFTQTSGAYSATRTSSGIIANGPFYDKVNRYFNAHNSNAVYTDNGLILPKSISKQSYIIYK